MDYLHAEMISDLLEGFSLHKLLFWTCKPPTTQNIQLHKTYNFANINCKKMKPKYHKSKILKNKMSAMHFPSSFNLRDKWEMVYAYSEAVTLINSP